MSEDAPKKSNRGFASMSPERRKEIASKGGKSVNGQNRAFSRDRALAQAAGRKGGLRSKRANRVAQQQEKAQ